MAKEQFIPEPEPKPKAEKVTKPSVPFVHLEGSGFVLLAGGYSPTDFRVMGLDGGTYDHVSELPSGEWVYRSA